MRRIVLFTLFFLTIFTFPLIGQEWEFNKEKDGIKIYTRSEENSRIKAFKAEIDIKTTMEIISGIIEDVEGFKEWDEEIKDIELLEYEENHMIRYYVVYNVQWPFKERDLCVEALITQDSITGKRVLMATVLENVVPEKPGIVRLQDYWGRWTMEPVADSMIHLTLEGSVDPGGSIPSWLANMVITDTPLNLLRKIKAQFE